MRRGSLLFLVFALVVALLSVIPAHAVSDPDSEVSDQQFESIEAEVVAPNLFKEQGNGVWVIHLQDAPLASYDGSTAGLAATGPQATGEDSLDVDTPEARAYREYLEGEQAAFIDRLGDTLDRSVNVRYQYFNVTNGVALYMTWQEASTVARMPEVSLVLKDTRHELTTDAGPAWIGAPMIWDGSATGVGTLGEGIVVGILDSGINPSNPSFAAVGGDGYAHTNPFGAGNYVGICDAGDPQYDASFPCNDKLIGAWNMTSDGTIFDDDGHGSHTASTTAGNVVTATLDAPTISSDVDISGVAPHANIISYDVCEGAGCDGTAIIAGIDQAVADGVNVINYSIGSPAPADPWTSPDDLAFLAARTAGVFVAHSAGNEGPGPETVGSPMAPWMTHVAAMTHNRAYPNAVISMVGGVTAPPADLIGLGFTSGYGPERIIFAGAIPADVKQSAVDRGIYADVGDIPDNNLCGLGSLGDFNSPWEPDTFQGEIVICDRGEFGRVEKGANVLFGGAGGYVLADNGGGLSGDAHELPGVHITQADGQVLKDWVTDGGTDHTASIAGATREVNDDFGDWVAGFSSRGPNRSADTIAPSLGAPGVDIIAAYGIGDPAGGEWDFLSGTSMSSPHVAGSAALLTALHPDWTPAMIESALMTTAVRDGVVIQDGVTPATPFDVGSGRVDLVAAANAALTLDETEDNYLDANPAVGGDVSTVNLASMANSQCVLECSFTRTVTSTASSNVTWNASTTGGGGIDVSVAPSSFSIAPGATQELVITVDVENAAANTWHFGSVELAPTSSVPPAHLPIAVQPTTGSIPGLVDIETRRDTGSWLVDGLEAIEIEELTVEVSGLRKAALLSDAIPEDPTNGDPFDDLDDVFVHTFFVGPPTVSIVAEITETTSPDLDLFMGRDDNGDGMPSGDEIRCASASGTSFESCVVDDPQVGSWWVVVQNWAGSGAPLDTFTMAFAKVTNVDFGNMEIVGPMSVPQLEPFSIQVLFDLPTSQAGDYYYGQFTLGTSPSKPGNIGTVPVRLVRLEDDVSKTADVAFAEPGDTITYEVVVHPNVMNQDLAYTITDTLPDGVTYVEGSATGGATHSNGVVTWEQTMPSPLLADLFYDISTNGTDASCDTPFGGYVNLEDFGILTQAGITGDTTVFGLTPPGGPMHFYGDFYDTIEFTDDGFAIFDSAANYGGAPWIPQAVPNADLPNNLLAGLWFDGEIFYDAALNHGVSLATAAGGTLAVIEYDDIQPWGGGPSLFDMNIIVWNAPGPGPEIVVAFDNVNLLPPTTTIGAENDSGTKGTSLINLGDPAGTITDGTVVCFDWAGPTFEPATFTYQVTVDEDAPHGYLTNTAVSITDMAGDEEAEVSEMVDIFNLGYILGQARPALWVILAELQDLLDNVEDTDTARDVSYLERAQLNLQLANRNIFWQDKDTLRPWATSTFWYFQRGAQFLQDINPTASFDEYADALAQSVNRVARNVTVKAIEDSTTHPWFIDRANVFVELGDAYAEDRNFGRAVAAYRYAFILANTNTARSRGLNSVI